MRMICGVAVMLVFAEEVSGCVICGAAVILAFAEEVSVRVICVPEGCRESMSCQSVLQECQVRVSSKSVVQSVKKACQVRVSYKSVLQECQVSVLQKVCQARVSSNKCQVRSVE